MKTYLALVLALTTLKAMAGSVVVEEVGFKGRPGYSSTARLVKANSSAQSGSIIIVEQKDGDPREVIVSRSRLSYGTEEHLPGHTTLTVNETSGSLIIVSSNDGIGRNRWQRELVVAYRNNKYKVVGFAYSSYDTLDPEAGESCQYNLQTKRGTRNNHNIQIEQGSVDFGQLADTELMYSCNDW